jgi:hypothetical protein
MLRDREWGDQVLLYAYGRAVHVNIRMIQHGMVYTPRSDLHEEEDEDIYVLFVRNNHFDAVVEKGEVPDSDPDEMDRAEEALDDELLEEGITLVVKNGEVILTGLEDAEVRDGSDDELISESAEPSYVIFFVRKDDDV